MYTQSKQASAQTAKNHRRKTRKRTVPKRRRLGERIFDGSGDSSGQTDQASSPAAVTHKAIGLVIPRLGKNVPLDFISDTNRDLIKSLIPLGLDLDTPCRTIGDAISKFLGEHMLPPEMKVADDDYIMCSATIDYPETYFSMITSDTIWLYAEDLIEGIEDDADLVALIAWVVQHTRVTTDPEDCWDYYLEYSENDDIKAQWPKVKKRFKAFLVKQTKPSDFDEQMLRLQSRNPHVHSVVTCMLESDNDHGPFIPLLGGRGDAIFDLIMHQIQMGEIESSYEPCLEIAGPIPEVINKLRRYDPAFKAINLCLKPHGTQLQG